MQAYYSLFAARFALLLQYRAAALAGIATQMFWGFIKIMVLQAFYTNTTSPQPMTFPEAVGYVWLGQSFLFAIVSPMAGILFLIIAIALWKVGERYYCSTGS